MKRILLVTLVILSCALAFAQTDIPVKGNGPYYRLVQGAAWGTRGTGGIENGYLIFPSKPSSNLCVTVRNNNPGSQHAFNVYAYIASSQDVTGYYGSAQPSLLWNPLYVISSSGTSQFNVNANAQTTFMVPSLAASEIEITISGTLIKTGSPDTADIYAVSTDAQSCSADTSGYPDLIGALSQTDAGSAIVPSTAQFPRVLGELPITASPVTFQDVNDNLTAGKTYVTLETNAAVFYACSVYLEVTALGGTSPSLSAYLDSTVPAATGGTHYFDIAAFQNPYTTTTGNGWAVISVRYGGSVKTPVQQALPASTVINGPIYGNLEMVYVLTGTNPTATASVYGVCQ